MRYEDLILNPEPVLTELFCFLLGVDSIEGTVVEKRIHEVSSSNHSTKSVYKLKNTDVNLNKSKHMYSKELKSELGEIMKSYIIFNGYSDIGLPEEDFDEDSTSTAFFAYDTFFPNIPPGIKDFNAETLTRSKDDQFQSFKFTNDVGGMEKLKMLDVTLTVKEQQSRSLKPMNPHSPPKFLTEKTLTQGESRLNFLDQVSEFDSPLR